MPCQGVVVGGVKEVNKPSKLPWMYENGRFPALFALKIDENAIFHFKVLNKIFSRDFFKEYINFKIFRYLKVLSSEF